MSWALILQSKAAQAAFAVVVVLALLFGTWVKGSQHGKSVVQQQWDADKLERSTKALETIKEYRAKEQELALKVKEAQNELTRDAKQNASTAAQFAADRGRMRDALAQYTRGNSANDTLSACGARAQQLEELLDSALQTSAACAERGEQDAATARSLLRSWPH